jgi:large subunit ribosomal protein L29
MSTTTTASELRHLDHDSLEEKLREAKEELFNLRFQAATGQLESHGRLRHVRRDIARIYTILRERELGITEQITSDGPGEVAGDDTPASTGEGEGAA